MQFRQRLISSAIGAALTLGIGIAHAQNSVDSTGIPAQTVKQPPAGSGMMRNKPTTQSAAMSPTETQTVKAKSSKAKTKTKIKTSKSKMSSMDNNDATGAGSVGSGSGGTTPGRVANTTNSNSKGEPAKVP